MCAALELNQKVLKPGKIIGVWRGGKPMKLPWAGFARNESLKWWQKKGGELVDVPAERFAERSNRDHQLRWDVIPAGKVVRGLLELDSGLLKIVTRASTPDEMQHFEHERMPLIEEPLFSCTPLEEEPDAQGELW